MGSDLQVVVSRNRLLPQLHQLLMADRLQLALMADYIRQFFHHVLVAASSRAASTVVQAIKWGMQVSRTKNQPMEIALTPDVEQYIQEKVSSGQYASASEVFLAGIKLLQDID